MIQTLEEYLGIPFFSVIIPTYNRAELLQEAVQSVLAQTFRNFELIIVDDHSTDETGKVARSFRDRRVRCITNDHGRGGAGTRNAGIFRAEGKWISFLDDDDLWHPQKLEKQYRVIMKGDPSVGLVYTGHAKCDMQSGKEMSLFVPQKEGWIQTDLVSDNCIGTLSSVAVRTDLAKQVGGLDERFPSSQDYEFYFRIAGLSKVALIKERLVLFRQHEMDRITGDMRKRLTARKLFWEKHGILIRDPRLRHRVAARYFVAATVEGDLKNMGKSFAWTLSGLLFDIPNVVRTVRSILSITARKRLGAGTGR